MLTSLAAILLPYRRKALFESSLNTKRLFGLPRITLAGLLSLLALAAFVVSILSDPTSGVSLSRTVDAGAGVGIPFKMFLFNVGVFLSGAVVYLITATIQKRRGIDISLAYRELPPE